MGTPIAGGAAQGSNVIDGGFGAAGNTKGRAAAKRALLAMSTLGTSEIKTGGGQYGDETVADSLFPKSINDALSDDRTAARKATDLANIPKPVGPAPDLTDKLLQGTGANSLLRQQTKQGRRSTFLTGGYK